MKEKFHPTLLSFALLAGLSVGLSVGLSGCGSSDSPEEGDDIQSTSPSSKNAPSKFDQPSTPSSSTPTAPPPPRPSMAPPVVLLPGVVDVQEAFAAALLASYNAMPPSPNRESWFKTEGDKVLKIKIQSCTQSSPGTVSKCQVTFNGASANINIMLTQSGWRLVA